MASKMTNKMAHKLHAPVKKKKKKQEMRETPKSTQDKQTPNSTAGNGYIIK